jgi:hypothetical protein
VSLSTRFGPNAAPLGIALERVPNALALAILLAGCIGQPVQSSVVDTGIQIVCRETSCRPSLVVEVGDRAWALGVGGGVAIVHYHNPVDVRVLDPATCRAFAEFTASPGSGWRVTFESAGTASVEETGAYELGPAMSEVPLTGCPEGSGSATARSISTSMRTIA